VRFPCGVPTRGVGRSGALVADRDKTSETRFLACAAGSTLERGNNFPASVVHALIESGIDALRDLTFLVARPPRALMPRKLALAR
jgi:hypothetical protein